VQVDLFTVIAQIVNFLILVWLLKRFLYGRIVRAMDEREERIAGEIEDAERARHEAEGRAEDYEQKQERLETEREGILSRTREEAEERKREMLDDARSEVEERRARWRESLEDERDAFLSGLRERVSGEVFAIAKRAVAEIADEDIEAGAAAAFARRLGRAGEDERRRFRDAARDTEGRVTVESANELAVEARDTVRRAIEDLVEENVELTFRVERSHALGVVAKAEGYRIGWTAADYVADLEERIASELEERTKGRTEAGRRTDRNEGPGDDENGEAS